MTKEKELVQLTREWYKKLADDGFEDIEYFDKDMEPRDMMYKEATKAGTALKDKFESTEQYYIEAGQFFHHYEFTSEDDKHIWFLHSEGHPYRYIANQLTAPYQTVFKIVNKYKDIMLSPLYRNQDGT